MSVYNYNITMDSINSNDDNYYDKLRTIRPFTESQLLTLYNNNELDSNGQFIANFVEENLRVDDNEFYNLLIRLEKSKDRHLFCSERIVELKKQCDDIHEKVWQLNRKVIIRPNRCADGTLVEAKHQHDEAMLCPENVHALEKSLWHLRETIANDHCCNSYLAQLSQLEVETYINDIVEEHDEHLKRIYLKRAISSLFSIDRRPKNHDNYFLVLTKNWLTYLVAVLLNIATNDDHLFLLNHVLRCPAGQSSTNACFIQCPSPLSVSDAELSTSYVNHCLTVMSTILSPIISREKFLGITKDDLIKKQSDDDTWLLVDPEDESEDVTACRLQISESDVVRYLKQIPFSDTLNYVSRFGARNDSVNGNSDGEISELIMLKLIAFSTTLIKILKQGLQSFNCTRYKLLTEHISNLIRQTVLMVSEFWIKCKNIFMSHDQALILRLQVEYDHFILRSIVAILSTNRAGVWRFLAVFPFNGVSESMMWHILWVVYNNGRDEHDELSGLCPYFSDTYWKSKFQDATVQYLWREKLTSLSGPELHYLLVTFFNMAKSRNDKESEFISTVTREIFEISFQIPSLESKMTDVWKYLTVLVSQFNFLISVCIGKVSEKDNENNETILDLFSSMPLHLWTPYDDKLSLLYDWITLHPITSLFNRIARLIFSKLNWNSSDDTTKSLYLDVQLHRNFALKIYEAINIHAPKDGKTNFSHLYSKQYGHENLILLAKSNTINDFTNWCWIMIMTLKLNAMDNPDIEWDSVIAGDEIESLQFIPIPNLNDDINLRPINKGLDETNPFAIYIALVMTDLGHSRLSIEKSIELFEKLISSHNLVPSVHILSCYLPLHATEIKSIVSNTKFVIALILLLREQSDEIISVILHHISKFSTYNRLHILDCWCNILYEVCGAILKSSSSSSSLWFSSNNKELERIAFIFDRMSMMVFSDTKLRVLFVRHICDNPYDIQSWKMSSQSWFGSLFNWGSGNSIKKSEWITPLHLLHHRFPTYAWLGWVLIDADSMRMAKIWDEIINEINCSLNDTDLEIIIKNVCQRHSHSSMPQSLLPIHSWVSQALHIDLNHDLAPLICYKFFIYYFSSGDSSGSIGTKFINDDTKRKLYRKLNMLIDYYHKLWIDDDKSRKLTVNCDDLIKLFNALIAWLDDPRLHEVYLNTDELPSHYMTQLLKCVMTNALCDDFISNYINLKSIEMSKSEISKVWYDLRSQFECDPQIEIEVTIADVPSKLIHEKSDTRLKAPEDKKSNSSTFSTSMEMINNNGPALLILIQHNIRIILEEAKFFGSSFAKYDTLNKNLIEDLPELYRNVKNEVKLRIGCYKDSYDHCKGPACITIEFVEASQNKEICKRIERNRNDFDNLIIELNDIPSNKVVGSALSIEKCLKLFLKSYDFHTSDQNSIGSSLLGSILLWHDENSDISYPPSKQIFATLLDALATAIEVKPDETNMFILETAMNYPKVIEHLAPRLEPSKCSSQCFLNMYRVLQEKLNKSPSHVFFVILSKFDISQWLKYASADQCQSLINILGDALYSFGNNPSEDKLIAIGLYRKHLQYALIFHFPDYLEMVLKILLKGMNDLLITPVLWNDVLLSFGFFITDNNDLNYLDGELKKYANNQPLFSANDLYTLLVLFSNHFNNVYNEHPLELIDHFKQYVSRFMIVLSTISYCWINVNSLMPPRDVNNLWEPFYNIWKMWIFPKRSTKFLKESDLRYVWQMFFLNIQYLISCFHGMTSDILSCVWEVILSYILNTKALIPTDLSIFYDNLVTLPWNRFAPSELNIKLMLDICQNDRYPFSNFIAYAVSQIDWAHALQHQFIRIDKLPIVMENLSYTLISVSSETQIDKIRFSGIPFQLIPTAKVQLISQMIIREMQIERLLDNDICRDKFLHKLLKELSLIEECDSNWFMKQLIYTRSVSQLIIDAYWNNGDLIKRQSAKVKDFVSQFFTDLRLNILKDVPTDDRVNLFNELFRTLNHLTNDDSRNLITEQYIRSLSFKDNCILRDVINSSCQTVKSLPNFVTINETFISEYFANDGSLTQLIEVFESPENSTDDYLVTCVTKNACLNLIIYLLKSLSQDIDQRRFISWFINWCCQIKPNDETEGKILLLWFKVLDLSDKLLDTEEHSIELMQSVYRLCKQLFTIVEESTTQGFLSFVRMSRKSFSTKCTFLSLCLTLYGCKRQIDISSQSHPLYSDLNNLYKSAVSKLLSFKKNKSFTEFTQQIDKVLDNMQYNGKEMTDLNIGESEELCDSIKSWMLIYYADSLFIRPLIK